MVIRSDETKNKNISTGEIEVIVDQVEILNESHQIPFQVAVEDDAPEELRLKYRFLDLENKKFIKILRSRVIQSLRNKMVKKGLLKFKHLSLQLHLQRVLEIF